MKKRVLTVLLMGVLMLVASSCKDVGGKSKKLDMSNETVRKSYAVGMDIGANLKNVGVELDINALSKAIEDKMKGELSLLNEKEFAEVMGLFRKEIMAARTQKSSTDGAKNIEEGKVYLEENKKKNGVKVTASGLQYKVLKSTNGKKPKATDKVKVHYKGTLLDGKVFDSSIDRGEPVTFPLNGVIKGWTEGVQLMNVGSKFEFVIPSELAYGPSPRPGGPIGPNAVLIFEIELLGIE